MEFKFNFTLAVWCIVIMVLFIYFIYLCVRKEKHNNINNYIVTRKYNILSILFIMIVGLSWIMNMGWLRFLFVIPIIFHIFIFYFSNNSYHKHANGKSKSMSYINWCNYATFLLFYVFLPDGGDTEDSFRVIFGLIKDEKFIDIAGSISYILFISNIMLIIIQIIYTQKVKIENHNKNK